MFKVQEVNVFMEGTGSLNSSISRYLDSLKGSNLWKVNYKELAKMIDDNKSIEVFSVRKNLPGKLYINIKFRKACFRVFYNNHLFLSDQKGVLFKALNAEEYKELIILFISDLKNVIEIKKFLNRISSFLKNEKVIKIIEINPKKYEFELFFQSGLNIITSDRVEEDKYKAARLIYLKLDNKVNRVVFDLRYDDVILRRL